jgi:DNA-binding GntR family transcriptional regulator
MWMACEQEVLIDTLAALQVQTRRILVYTRAYDRGEVEVEEHARLVDAALSGDPDLAEAATREHLIASRNLMLERMERLEREQRAGRDGVDGRDPG